MIAKDLFKNNKKFMNRDWIWFALSWKGLDQKILKVRELDSSTLKKKNWKRFHWIGKDIIEKGLNGKVRLERFQLKRF